MPAVQPVGTPIERVLAALKDVKSAGSGRWMALCPTHDDRTRSLSIKVGADGRVLLHCHAPGCTTNGVVAAIGLGMTDLFAEPLKREGQPDVDPRNRPRLIKSYDYTDANGALLYQACRFEPKQFRQRRKDDAGNWIWNLSGVEPVLYNLPAVLEAVALGKPVYVVEGEKDADALIEAGIVATTSPMGAGKWRPQYTKALSNAAVVVLPDNDEPGKAHAATVAAELTAAGSIVKVVNLPGIPPKGDVSDWFDVGGDSADLKVLCDRAKVWAPAGPRRVRWKLSDLLKNEYIMRPPPAVVPRLAWGGRSTLLAAREKSGKSTLISFIAAQVTNPERQFLGEHTIFGDVLIVGLEEYLGDVARRLQHFGADPDRTTLVDGFLGDPQQRTQEIRAHIEELTPVLVVVDSLVAFANGRGIDENDAAMATIVQPLTDLSHETGTAMIIVHHASKGTGKARGSTSIMGATDVVCEFFAPDEDADPTLRRMRSVGRVPLVRSYDLRFDGDTYTTADGLDAPIEPKITRVVSERPGINMTDLTAAIGGRREAVLGSIRSMLASGFLLNRGESMSRPKLYVAHPSLI